MWRLISTICFFSLINLQCQKGKDINLNNNNGEIINTPKSYNYKLNPGSSAKDFLRNLNYRSLKIEIQYMPSLKLTSGSIDYLKNFLQERLNKPDGIIIEQKEIYPTIKTVFSLLDLESIEDRNRQAFTNNQELTAYILVVDGSYESINALALSYRNTSMCIFGEPLKYYSIGSDYDAKARTEAMLLEHEFGHLFGLVNNGTFMVSNHEDAINTRHCLNYNCLMHHTLESYTRIFAKELREIPLLDANCVSDLKANGGK